MNKINKKVLVYNNMLLLYLHIVNFYLKQEVSFAGHKPVKAIVQALSISLNSY